jgi:hypothetical protein
MISVYFQENKWRSHESGDKATRVDMLARVAIKFLNSSFQKSDPRVRGQTVEEVVLLDFWPVSTRHESIWTGFVMVDYNKE